MRDTWTAEIANKSIRGPWSPRISKRRMIALDRQRAARYPKLRARSRSQNAKLLHLIHVPIPPSKDDYG
jgi:hypothetical protein